MGQKQSINIGSALFKVNFGLVMVVLLMFATVVSTYAYTSHSQSDSVAWAQSQKGKSLDYDGVYGAQCVDLIAYYYRYLGTSTPGGNANAYAYNTLPSGWKRVAGNYQPGDIAVWKVNHSCSTCGTSSLGHVGIITSADSVGFNAVNQNFNGQSFCTENWFYVSALQCAIRPDFSHDTQAPSLSNISISEISTQ
ncbi:MAG: CHAP domain-containing protein, partial [Lachnospiraceae bacterium]|nr:CHAP domain-containing protein [Lachnospiraceae bacterium]